MSANPNLTPASRAERAAEAARLRDEEGLNGIQIAERMGVSRSFAYELLNDPAGERARARKLSYGGSCVDCGAPTDGSNGKAAAAVRCKDCSGARQGRAVQGSGAHTVHERARERHEELARMWRDGATQSQLAAHFNVSKGQIRVWVTRLRGYGYDLPYRRTPEQRAHMLAAQRRRREHGRERDQVAA